MGKAHTFLVFTIFLAAFPSVSHANYPYSQIAYIHSSSGSVKISLSSNSGLNCKKTSSNLFECNLEFESVYDFLGLNAIYSKEIASEVGDIELYLADYSKGSLEKISSFESSIRKIVDVKVPNRAPFEVHKLRGSVANPEKLVLWVRTAKFIGGGYDKNIEPQIFELPVTYDSITQQELETKKKAAIASQHPGEIFYPNLGLNGEWRSPENRQDSGECNFGYTDGDGHYSACEQVLWEETSDSDGFSSSLKIGMDSADDEYSTGQYSNLEIICTSKKLGVNVYFKYASSVGWKGNGLVRFDNGVAKKFTYRVDRSLDYFWLENPKTFTGQLLKAKNKVSFKVANQYARILVFPKSDLNSWTKKFKAAGCPLQ